MAKRKQRIKPGLRRLHPSTRDAIATAPLTHREIAMLYAVSLATVSRIRTQARANAIGTKGKPGKCPRCGHSIQTPDCAACNASRSRKPR